MCREQNVVTNLVSNNRKARYESSIYPIIKYPFSNLYLDRKYPLIELNVLIPAFETGITIFLRTCNVVYNITFRLFSQQNILEEQSKIALLTIVDD